MARARRKHSATNGQPFSATQQSLNPGDEAAPGTPGTGEDMCPACRGSGRVNDAACPNCGGTGLIVEGIGGA
jgi:DnaJ-class molecular chaperone